MIGRERETRNRREPSFGLAGSVNQSRARLLTGFFRRPAVLLFGTLVGFALTGCERGPSNLPEEEVSPPETFERAVPKRLLLDLYIDTSFSMRGFAASSLAPNRDYAKLTGALVSLARRNPGNVVHEYRWDADHLAESRWSSISDPSQITDPNFYRSREDGHPLLADLLPSSASATRFTVVTSDLRFDAPETANSPQRLAAEIIRQNQSFGILSVRLPFDGQIDRLIPEIDDFAYRGSRRFYVLFFGHPLVVEQFAQSLKVELQRQLIDADALIVSRRLVHRRFDLADARIDHLVGLARLTPSLGQNRAQLLELGTFPDTIDGSVQLSIPLDRSADGFGLTPQAIEIVPTVFIWRPNGWKEIAPDKMNLEYQIKIGRDDGAKNIQERLTFSLAISAPAFSQPGWYYLEFGFRAKPRELVLPGWIADANLPGKSLLENAPGWNGFQGRTPGLREFLESFRQAIPGDFQELGNLRILLKRQGVRSNGASLHNFQRGTAPSKERWTLCALRWKNVGSNRSLLPMNYDIKGSESNNQG
jgi:hypothetical protein